MQGENGVPGHYLMNIPIYFMYGASHTKCDIIINLNIINLNILNKSCSPVDVTEGLAC